MAKNDPALTIKTHTVWRDLNLTEHETGVRGQYHCRYYGLGPVDVFTHDGTQHGCSAFTTLEMTVMGQVHTCRLGRAYHPRWLGRLASTFAHQVWLLRRDELT